ncbi:Hint domain-containing homing endonuclease [Micromonospora avicenniae]|uniref:Hint domain-containing homing endonuclease n=1 Tax=Micromonospora avicenniae TaxID=1198245 RepID=UPI00343B93B7
MNRFLTRDAYGGALADMGLSMDPFTGNRYAFAGGNPVSFVELDGHLFGMSWSDIGHAALDVAGMVPVIGEVADVANGIWYAAEGNYVDAALSMASAIPLAGNAVAAAKLAKTGKKIADGIDTAKDLEKGVEATVDGQKALPTNTPKPKTETPTKPGCNSFVPGTRVLLADGSTKPIEQVQVGDKVLASDVESGDRQTRPVTALIPGEGVKHLYTITVDTDGGAGDQLVGTAVQLNRAITFADVVVGRRTAPIASAGRPDLPPGYWPRRMRSVRRRGTSAASRIAAGPVSGRTSAPAGTHASWSHRGISTRSVAGDSVAGGFNRGTLSCSQGPVPLATHRRGVGDWKRMKCRGPVNRRVRRGVAPPGGVPPTRTGSRPGRIGDHLAAVRGLGGGVLAVCAGRASVAACSSSRRGGFAGDPDGVGVVAGQA